MIFPDTLNSSFNSFIALLISLCYYLCKELRAFALSLAIGISESELVSNQLLILSVSWASQVALPTSEALLLFQ